MSEANVKCLVDGKTYPENECYQLRDVDSKMWGRIKNDYPNASESDYICDHHLLKYQLSFFNQLIRTHDNNSEKINKRLTKSMADSDYKIQNINNKLNGSESFGQRFADIVAKFGGSWGFIFSFTLFLLMWMFLNQTHLFGIDFDTYPFILLNLALSCLAALQSPIIMMSQNRADQRDRLAADNDFHVNLKSESELRLLHAKIDQLNNEQVPNSLAISRNQLQILGKIQDELVSLNERMDKLEEKNSNK